MEADFYIKNIYSTFEVHHETLGKHVKQSKENKLCVTYKPVDSNKVCTC